MPFIDTLTDWFTDPGRTLPQKLAVAVIILFLLYTVNDLLGFSYYYRINKKVENFERLTQIISNEKTDSTSRAQAMALRDVIMCKEPSYFSLLNLFVKLCKSISTNKRQVVKTTVTTTNIAANVSMRNEILFFVSSSGIYAIIGVMMIPIILFSRRQPIIPRIASAIIVILIFGFVTTSLYALTDFIPIILNKWAFNYIVNALIQLSSIIILVAAVKQHSRLAP